MDHSPASINYVSFNLTHSPVFPQTIFLVEWTYYSKLVPGSVVHAPYFHTVFFLLGELNIYKFIPTWKKNLLLDDL